MAVDHTAVRVALWRALHVAIDAAPHVLVDEVGLKLVAPEANWRERPDMNPEWTKGYRASIVGRSRLIEDLVGAEVLKGTRQYVILGAGLDTFAQRQPNMASKLEIFEVERPGTLQWKQERLIELGFGIPATLHQVPVDFEAGESWREKIVKHGFEMAKPAVVSSTGVSMYLSKETNQAALREIASFAPGTKLAMTFMLPLELLDPVDQPQFQMVLERTKAAGTPMLSFFKPAEMLALAKEAGFSQAEHISTHDVIARYFSGRSDGLRPASGEEFLIATV